LTNVNFSPERFHEILEKTSILIDNAKAEYEKVAKKPKKFTFEVADDFKFSDATDFEEINNYYTKNTIVGVENRKEFYGDDVVALEELLTYGLKGYAAYAVEGTNLGKFDPKVYAFSQEAWASLADIKGVKKDANAILAMALKCGEVNLRVLELLDEGGNEKFGTPSPHEVSITPVEGKCILVSGHNLGDLENILKATEGKNINVYTHGEMLPAHGYPELRKYKHLVGNYGGAWQLQKMEFAMFPGSVIVTSNCVLEPSKRYANRLFTIGPTGVVGAQHIENDNFKPLIEAALKEKGFTKNEKAEEKKLLVGFGHKTVLSLADVIVGAVKNGEIERFHLIGGCDGSEGERNYFRKHALSLPKNHVIMTLGCAKFRFNKENFGNIETKQKDGKSIAIPRLLDLGQCNDSYSALKIAMALADAFKTDINSLPLSYSISWFEQKAVVIFLTLMHLGVKGIQLGPFLPAFIPPTTLKFLVDNLNVSATPN
jgi:hydroxylamine reductase